VQNVSGSSAPVRGVLLDLGGVVYVGDTPIGGALSAVARLREAELPLRFVTNTTRRSRRQVIADLQRMGLRISDEELLTPASMARAFLQKHQLSPFLVVHPELVEDFAGLASGHPEAVIIGDAGDCFTYERLNRAYRKITEGAVLLALAMNRNFKDADGELSLDAGPFVAALEYASKRKAVLLGKPSAEFYQLAVASLGSNGDDLVMVGDDAEADVSGAISAGLRGVLVRTGKYRAGDESALPSAPDCIADSLNNAVDWILQRHQSFE
jgi:HAD superfamily hydrolase (TIGR01458 family)